jgi:hypothetical protein
MLLNLFFGEGEDFTSLYVAIMGLALIAHILKAAWLSKAKGWDGPAVPDHGWGPVRQDATRPSPTPN